MNKKIISVVSVLLALVMTLSLVACGGDKKVIIPEANGPTVAPPTPYVKPEGEASTIGAPTAEKGNVPDEWVGDGVNGNKDLRLPKYAPFPSNEVRFLCHFDLGTPDPDRYNAIRDAYGLTYTTIVTAPEEKLNKFLSLAMSGDVPEILCGEFSPSLINKGYLAPWDDYVFFDIGLWSVIKESVDSLAYNGKHYSISGTDPGRGTVLWYNKKLFEENGVKTPREYYLEGNWTWDTMRDCAKALTIDADSNGTPEIWGLSIEVINCLIYTTGKDIISIEKDGTIQNNIKSEGMARAMQFYIDLTVKDKVNMGGTDGVAAMLDGSLAMLTGGYWIKAKLVDMIKDGSIDLVPIPRDPKSDKYYIEESFGSESLAANCTNPYAAGAVMTAGRYNTMNAKFVKPLTDEELLAAEFITNDMRDWYETEFFKADKTPALSTWITFGLAEFWGDIWFRPTQGEPWATIAEELSPRLDQVIERILE